MKVRSSRYWFFVCRFIILSHAGLLVLLAIQGCAVIPRNPAPEKIVKKNNPIQQHDIRVVVNPFKPHKYLPFFNKGLSNRLQQHSTNKKIFTMLAISGGGENGAFGAGLLYGWSEKGDRPAFDVVTGISTGALMAPFAFLGESYDETLKKSYTEVSSANIYNLRGLGEIARMRDAIASTGPLRKMLEETMTAKVIQEIAQEHATGRRLYIGTTNLDLAQLVVWDMGAIASSQHPKAHTLFRDVLLASASIPIAFPPVYLKLSDKGQEFDEMHVDGGLTNQVFGAEFLAPLILRQRESGADIKVQIYMIRNSLIQLHWDPVKRKLLHIAERSINAMINTQALSDIYRNFVFTKVAGAEFFLSGIPSELQPEAHEGFDPTYMNELFTIGYEHMNSGDAWKKSPPGIPTPDLLDTLAD